VIRSGPRVRLCVFLLALLASSRLAAQAPETADLLVRGGTIVTMDGDRRVLENGAIDDTDIATLVRRQVGVAHCPQSNMKLASGTSPVPALVSAGIAVGLGTDGAASNNDLDLWEEMDTAAKLHKLIS
jgi:adenosine deaminase